MNNVAKEAAISRVEMTLSTFANLSNFYPTRIIAKFRDAINLELDRACHPQTNYVSHMRATFFDESEQPVHTVDGQFIAVDALQIFCDGTCVAEYSLMQHKWYVYSPNRDLATRVVFNYVDENQRTLPSN